MTAWNFFVAQATGQEHMSHMVFVFTMVLTTPVQDSFFETWQMTPPFVQLLHLH